MKTTPHPRSRRSLIVLACLALALLAAVGLPGRAQPAVGVDDGAGAPAAGSEEEEPVSWNEVDRLISEQKYEAAHEEVMALLEQARSDDDADTWTRALVEAVKLRMALHGYETAVRFLKDEPWPEDAVSRAVLELYYANALATYARAYSWEIRQRERVETGGELDLESWTLEQIVEAADRAYLSLWRDRAAWGGEPLGEVARYIDQNSYPPRIRGTFRDAVSYLWVEQLADSSLWSPVESNELYRLEATALLAGADGAIEATGLDDPDVHPVLKIAAILSDLETWHGNHRRPEAALEARLELVRRLHEALTADEERTAIRAHLTDVLERFDRSLRWWSMGQAVLAELLQRAPNADALIEARAAALAGHDRHPDSVGGLRCAHVVAAIERPSFDLESMALDGAGTRSLQIDHTNLERLHFRAWRYDLVDFVERAEDWNLLPSTREAEAIMAGRPAAAWSVALPATPDFRSHRTYAVPELREPGAWLIAASMREDFAEPGNQMAAVNFLLSDLVLLTCEADEGYEVTARSGASGRALEDVEVTLYRFDYQQGHRAVEQRRTGADGRTRFGARSWGRNQYFVLASLGQNLALDPSRLWRPAARTRDVATSALVATDRAVYRPVQELHWKVVAYRGGGEEIEYETLPATDLEVTLVDANGDEVATTEVTTNSFGSASGSFQIPAGRLLGQWRLRTSIGGDTWLRVEEYKRPTFEVTIAEPQSALRLNREAALKGEALYYFGLPVTSGEARWRVTREPVYPPWWWWGPPPAGQPQVVAAGRSTLDEAGSVEMRFTPEADEREAASGVTYRYRLAVDVTDEGGETRSAERVFRLGFVAVEARIDSDFGFLTAGEATALQIIRSDLDGTPRPGSGSWRLVRLEQPPETVTPADQPRPDAAAESPYATPGDRLRPRWQPGYNPSEVLSLWPDGEELATGALDHGADGTAVLPLPGLDAGAYRLRYTTRDEFGAEFTTMEHLVVAGERRTPLALPALLRFERPSVAVGETARLLVHTGFTAQEMVLEIWRDGRRVDRRPVGAGRSGIVELPVGVDDRGGFGVTLTLVRDHQLVRQTARLEVPWDDRRLDIAFATFRDTMRPGTRETFAVTVRRPDGGPVGTAAAELLALMYDRSLDIFAPFQLPSVAGLYPDRSAVGGLRSNLGLAARAWGSSDLPALPGYPPLEGDRLELFEAYGIGGPGGRGVRAFKAGMVAEARAEMAAMPSPAADAAMANDESLGIAADAEPASGGAEGEEAAELRSDFSETAFWRPHVVLADDGSATVEFEVPDSVTEWSLWVQAVTRDLRGGSVNRRARSVKELMVRPYLPRFLREGDRSVVQVVVNNAGEAPLAGSLDLEILDPATGEDLLPRFGLDRERATGLAFEVAPGQGTTLGFPITTPPRVGEVAFKVTARAGDFSDGELRSLPVLPGRMHLMQSRFVTLHDEDRRELHFADLAAQDDPTLINDQLVVTVDGQLFYSVLDALPYLIDYPYECTEQTLNRFLSTGIVASLFDRYPAVERMAEQLSARETRYEAWRADDSNRAMSLVETPWLALSRGGGDEQQDLIKVLDPAVTRAQRSSALAALQKGQTSLGGFPWFPGGPPSPWMTLYILSGFAKGLEFGVEPPEDMVRRAWAYLHRHWIDEWADWMVDRDCCWETITFLNSVLSSYPDESWTGGVFTVDDRRRMLDFSFRHWREHSPLTKAHLALTLERAGRHDDAVLVFDAVMDSAKSDPDLGTYWAPEDRAWLWYNDTIETHAFALRTLTELAPDDARRDGLVQWLFLNKKLNHWKSTRATAEVLYSLAHYLQQEEALSSREVVRVTAGPRTETFAFEPDEYSGAHNQMVVEGEAIEPETMATIVVDKETPGFAFASATWHFSTERLPTEARGDLFAVERTYFRRVNDGSGWVLQPLADGTRLEVGDQVEVQLAINAAHEAEYVHLRDPRGSGFEPESLRSEYKRDLGIAWYEEVRDSGTNFFFEWLPAGEYTFKYRLRATMAGTFRVAPTVLQSMYAPEFTAYSAGHTLEIASD